MITREQVMEFFRDYSDDNANLNSLSTDDKYELIMELASFSEYLSVEFEFTINAYEADNE